MDYEDPECVLRKPGTVPQVFQSEASECGLACLNMVAWSYGQKTDLATLRRRFSLSLKGLTLRSIMEIAGQLGLASRPVRFELHDINQLALPCILHWDLSHFVVLVKASDRRITIHDPSTGRKSYTLSAASHHITGVALEITPSAVFKPEKQPQKLRISDFWTQSRGFPTSIAYLGICIGLAETCSVIFPFVGQLVVDSAIANGDKSLIFVICSAFFFLLLLRSTVTLIRSLLSLRLSTSVNYQMEVNLFKHLSRLPSNFFERRHVGDIVSRFESVSAIQTFITSGLITLIVDGLLAVLTITVMFIYSNALAFVSVSCLIVSVGLRLAFLPVVRNKTSEQINSAAREQSVFLESVRAQRAVKIFGRENERTSIWQNSVVDNVNSSLSLNRVGLYSEFLQDVIWGVEGLAVIGIGASLVVNGDLTLGMLFAFQAYSGQFSSRANSLVDILLEWRMLGLHKGRLADISRTPQEQGLAVPSHEEAPRIESLSLSNVRVRYSAYEPWILDDLSLRVEAGDCIVISGPSGSGKSTLLKTLIGLIPPIEGRVLVNDYPLNSYGLSNFRAALGVVMQDDTLLSGTIVDNISFFAADVDIERVMDAAKLACVHSDIMRLPMGYQSLVGDMGSVLSGGQKQRILIARALFRNPQVLILDEGTANLDMATESDLLQNLKSLSAIKIVITHGTGALSIANRSFRLDFGELEETTTGSMPAFVNEDVG